MSINNVEFRRQYEVSSAVTTTVRFLVITVILVLFAASPAFGVSEYSDAWIVEPADPEAVYTEEPTAPFNLIGVGISEADYDSNVYATSTFTTLTSPSGVTISSYSDGYTYARAEAFSLQLNPETAEEGEYAVTSEHTYYLDTYEPCPYSGPDQPAQPCYQSKALPNMQRPLLKRAAFTSPPTPNAPSFLSFFRRITRFFFFISIKYTGYQNPVLGYGGCRGDEPFGYAAFCPLNNICQKAYKCAPGAAPGIQGVGLLLNAYFFQTCTVKYYYVPMRPRCS